MTTHSGSILMGVATTMVCSSAFGSSNEATRPNVLIILVDDYGWCDTGCTGSQFYETPNIDNIAKNGVNFTNGYAACPVSSPSRASIMTGVYTPRHGVTDWINSKQAENKFRQNITTPVEPATNALNLSKRNMTIAEALREAGYTTFIAGKWHLGEQVTPEMRGFDINKGGYFSGGPRGGYFSPYDNPKLEDGPLGENLSERLGRETASFIEAQVKSKDKKPFFAYLSFYAVHGPIQTTEQRWKKYREKLLQHEVSETGFAIDGRLPVRLYQDNPVYAGLIEQMDNGVGIVMDKIKELGIDKNILIILTGDNGGVASGDNYSTSNYPLRGGKGRLWEGGLRVPFIVQAPDCAKAGEKDGTPVNGIDCYSTILDYAGLKPHDKQILDGVSIRPLVQGGTIAARPMFWHYPHYGNQGGEPGSVIRDGEWKLIYFHETEKYELYNLRLDRTERDPLNNIYPEKAEQLKTKLMTWLKDINAKMPTPNPKYNETTYNAFIAKRNQNSLKAQEKLRHDILQPQWQPNPTWWDSRIVND